jgi:hypothetical protein
MNFAFMLLANNSGHNGIALVLITRVKPSVCSASLACIMLGLIVAEIVRPCFLSQMAHPLFAACHARMRNSPACFCQPCAKWPCVQPDLPSHEVYWHDACTAPSTLRCHSCVSRACLKLCMSQIAACCLEHLGRHLSTGLRPISGRSNSPFMISGEWAIDNL